MLLAGSPADGDIGNALQREQQVVGGGRIGIVEIDFQRAGDVADARRYLHTEPTEIGAQDRREIGIGKRNRRRVLQESVDRYAHFGGPGAEVVETGHQLVDRGQPGIRVGLAGQQADTGGQRLVHQVGGIAAVAMLDAE